VRSRLPKKQLGMIRKSGFPVFRKDHAPMGNLDPGLIQLDRLKVEGAILI
jgi:hypothetical protein